MLDFSVEKIKRIAEEKSKQYSKTLKHFAGTSVLKLILSLIAKIVSSYNTTEKFHRQC